MKKKLLITFLTLVCVITCTFALAACVRVRDDTVHVTDVTLSTDNLDIEVGEEVTLTATVFPDNATNKTVVWTVDDESIATVDNNGKITALSEGTAIVRATADNTFHECRVFVRAKTLVEHISMDTSVTLLKNGETTLTATVHPENAKSPIVWSVEPEGIVSVDGGKLTALAQGKAIVTASADDVTAQCNVTVTYDGLKYQLNDDGQSYSVNSNFHNLFPNETDFTEITVASEYNEKPVTAIGRWAFGQGIDCLKRLVIPASITDIDTNSLIYCDELTSIEVDKDNTQYASVDGILYNKAVTESVFVPYGITGVVEIPEAMTKISDYMFQNRKNLTGVKMHDGVTAIGKYAFSNCLGINSFTVTKNITEIESDAFHGCYKLWEIYNLSGLEIEKGGDVYTAPYGGIGLYALLIMNSATLPGGMHKTDEGFTFYTASGKTYLVDYTGTESQITLPEKFERHSYIINTFAFFDNNNITSISIPEGAVIEIRREAFSNCSNLKKLTLSTGLQNIGMTAFGFCGIDDIIFNGTLEQWNAIEKNEYWDRYMYSYNVVCTDGKLDEDGNVITE